MKHTLKKFSASIAAIAILTTSFTAIPANAEWCSGSTTASAEGHKSFSSDWSENITIDIDVAGDTTAEVTVTIGFDTWCQDEDYVTRCWAPTGWKHYAKVKNSKGTTESTGTARGGVNTGKADVKHTGKSVTYYGYINV